MNQNKKTTTLILILGILLGILVGYNIGYHQGKTTGHQEELTTLTTIENKYKLLLLLEKLNQIQELETIAIKQALQPNTNNTLATQTSNTTIQITREAYRLTKTINCNPQTTSLLENLTKNLVNLTQETTKQLSNNQTQEAVNTYKEIINTINEIVVIIKTC